MEEGHGAGNDEVLQALFSTQFVLHCPDGSHKNRHESSATYSALRNALSDFDLRNDLTLTEGAHLSARTVMEGRFTQKLPMAPSTQAEPNGDFVHFETISIHRFDEEAKLVEEWAQSDNLTLMAQLGVVPAS